MVDDETAWEDRKRLALKLIDISYVQINHSEILEFTMRTPVKIERGKFAGKVGTIAGRLEDREPPITKAIVKIDDTGARPEFELIDVANLRELTQMEMIVLGFK